MSTGPRLTFAEAKHVGLRVSSALKPHVERLKCTGSVRRQKAECSDIEFLAIPFFNEGLFDTGTPILEPVEAALRELGSRVTGGQRKLVAHDVLGHEGFRCELHLCHPPATWGVLLAIDTGPWQLSKYLVTACKARGVQIKDGRAIELASGEQLPTDEEEQFFALAGCDECPLPRDRYAYSVACWNDFNRGKTA